jgi:hypothetical protein
MFNGTELQRAKERKFMAALMRQGSIISTMIKHAACRGRAAIAVTYNNQLGVASNFDIMLRLFHAVVIPNMSFGCAVWGPWALQSDMVQQPAQNVVELVCLLFLRVLLALKSSTPTWTRDRELGMYPLQMFVLMFARQLVRFINKLWTMHENTWARQAMLEAWVLYRSRGHDNWCAWLDASMASMGHSTICACTWGDALIFVGSDVQQDCHAVFLAPGLSSKSWHRTIFRLQWTPSA